MPLVDYGSSDESDSGLSPHDEKEDSDVGKVELVKKDEEDKLAQNSFIKETSNDTNPTETKLFSQLPVPKSTFSLGEDSLRLLSKNKNQPVKILLPSLNDLKSGDNDDIRKKKPSTKGSGLFALLPAPKNLNNFIPKSITNKLSNSKKPKAVPKINQLNLSKSSAVAKGDEEEDENGENPSSFFFNSSDDIVLPEVPIDEPVIDTDKNNHNNSSMVNLSTSSNMLFSNSGSSSESKYTSYTKSESDTVLMEAQNDQDFSNLDDEAIEKLCGTRARKRKGEIPEEVIDINVDSMVGDAYMWLSKDLTKGHEHTGYKKAKNLSTVERRKHQITYLASQAKEKEMELRNQWANSRMTRKQTQSKYGF